MVITDVNQVVYQGNGSNTAFPFTFRIIDATDIKLLLIDADGTETNITSDYFVDINTNTVHYPGYAPGSEPAEADQPAPVQTGQKLMIYRKLPITQEKDLGDKWPFYVIELGLDKLTMILQDIWDWCGRCLQVSRGQAAAAGEDFDPTIPLEADKVIAGNANGTGFVSREAMMEVNGAWDGEGRQIKGVADPTSEQDAATKNYVDTLTDNNFMKLQPDGTAWEGRNLPIGNVAGPALIKDAANKDYVDRILAGYSGQGERFVFFDNVAQMQAAELVPTQMAVTLGYHDVNDGGAGVYSIRDIGADTPDGGSIIEIPGTDYVAELITYGTVNVKQFGAYGDNIHDDTDAIVACANYCSANDKILYSDNATYKTTTNCIISMVDQIELHGYFTFLDVRYRHTKTNQFLQLIEKVDHLILRDYKNTTFHIGYADIVDIIADYAVVSGSSFAYCMFYGGYWKTCNIIGGTTGGWVNENSFYRIRMNTLSIGVGGGYHHSNNRFYDVTLEEGTINLDCAQSNYIRVRAEGGVTVNRTSAAYNNIVEQTWVSSKNGFVNATYPTANNSYVRNNMWLNSGKIYKLLSLDINNVTWDNAHDFTKGIATIHANNSYGLSSSLGSATIEFTEDVWLCAYGNGQRFSMALFDADGNRVTKEMEDVVNSSAFAWSSEYSDYRFNNNTTKGARHGAYINYVENTTIKYIKVYIRQGSSTTAVTECGFYGITMSGKKPCISQRKSYSVSKTKPTLTTDVPQGFEVINIGTNTAIWKWVFNGTEWVQIDYPTQA